jgi:hypothetical protein
MKKLLFAFVPVLAMFPVSVFADQQARTQITTGVPEPTSLILIISGLVGVFGLRRILGK